MKGGGGGTRFRYITIIMFVSVDLMYFWCKYFVLN